jgi:hypothetical protein
MTSEVLSTETKFTPGLDDDELETILIIAKNEQTGRITPSELKELVRVYRVASDLYEALADIDLQWCPYSDADLERFAMMRPKDDGKVQPHWAEKILAARRALLKARGGSSNEGE